MDKLTPLTEIFGHSKLCEYFEEHKTKPWNEWLTFDNVFDKPGKQGLVGLLSPSIEIEGLNRQFVFKISQYINYLVHHESVIMEGLNTISPFCVHFCKSIGSIMCNVNPKSRKEGNPFNITSNHHIQKEVLLSEYIDKSYKLYNYIRATDKISEDMLFSTIKQVMMALSIAQNKKRFSHYDLHSYNIMMRKCNKDVVFLYVMDEENQYAVATHGNYPVIIDFGFSYIEDMQDGPLWMSLAHTDVGFTSDRFDWVADPKLFLVTVASEIRAKRKTPRTKKLQRIVKNIFSPLNIDWSSGWDDGKEESAADFVIGQLENCNIGSRLFGDFDHFCIDILQSLIILPLEKQDSSGIEKAYKAFLKQWIKIENEISSPFYNLYILKGIVDAARYVRAAYMYKTTRESAITTFRQRVYARIDEVANFCKPKKINFEKMLCSVLVLATCIEGLLYDVTTKKAKSKAREYRKLPLRSVEQIYGAIQTNIPDIYTYNLKTKVVVFDCVNERTDYMFLDGDSVDLVNNSNPLCKGVTLYDIYKQK